MVAIANVCAQAGRSDNKKIVACKALLDLYFKIGGGDISKYRNHTSNVGMFHILASVYVGKYSKPSIYFSNCLKMWLSKFPLSTWLDTNEKSLLWGMNKYNLCPMEIAIWLDQIGESAANQLQEAGLVDWIWRKCRKTLVNSQIEHVYSVITRKYLEIGLMASQTSNKSKVGYNGVHQGINADTRIYWGYS